MSKATAFRVTSRSNGKLPNGWRMVKFGDVVRDVKESERNPLEAGLERYIGLEHIEPENLHLREWGDLTTDEVSFTKRFRKGQVLFGKRRAYQRKVAVAEFDGICSSDILTFEPRGGELMPELLPFIVQSTPFFEHALGTSSGSISPRTRWSQLKDFEFPLPPIPEQNRIIKLLWAADRAIEAYSHSHTALQRLRVVASKEMFQAPEEATVLLGQLIESGEVELQTGPFGTVLSASSYTAEGTPVVNPVHMNGATFNTVDGPFVSDADADRLRNYALVAGDVVMVRKRHVGRMVHVLPEHEGFILGSDCIRIRIQSDRLSNRYFFLLLQCEQIQRWLVRVTSGTVMPGINEVTLRQLKVPIVDSRRQEEIVSCLDAMIAAAANIESHTASVRDAATAVAGEFLCSHSLAKGSHDV